MPHAADRSAEPTITLTDEIVTTINGAPEAGRPLVVAYVDEAGAPHLSIRGTVQVLDESRLGLWSRSPGLPRSIGTNPRLELLYQHVAERTFLRIGGRAFVETSEEVRDRIFDGSPQREQAQDPHRSGVAVVIELDSVEGMTPSGPVRLTRAAAVDA